MHTAHTNTHTATFVTYKDASSFKDKRKQSETLHLFSLLETGSTHASQSAKALLSFHGVLCHDSLECPLDSP